MIEVTFTLDTPTAACLNCGRAAAIRAKILPPPSPDPALRMRVHLCDACALALASFLKGAVDTYTEAVLTDAFPTSSATRKPPPAPPARK